jgi:hypothetical protein
MTVRSLRLVALLLVGCPGEPPPASATPPAPTSAALPASADAGGAQPVTAAAQVAPREMVADAGAGGRTVHPGSASGSASGFRAPPTTDGADAGVPVGPRRPYGPIPTMDEHRRVKPPPLNPRTAPPPGPLFPHGPSHAADAGTAGPAVE